VRVEFSQHLLVDGYNVAHAWPEVRHVLNREGRDAARSRLVERLRVLHDYGRLRVSVVFDGRGQEIAIERPTAHNTFSVVYTPGGMTADDLIEQLAAQSASPASVYVATADQAERDTIEAAGARAVSPQQLAEWIERVMREQDGALTEQRKRTEREWRRGGHG
jgi:predicted RNA-binding protein with PIN domain